MSHTMLTVFHTLWKQCMSINWSDIFMRTLKRMKIERLSTLKIDLKRSKEAI